MMLFFNSSDKDISVLDCSFLKEVNGCGKKTN